MLLDWHQRWRWLASTLSPYYEGNDLGVMIDEDIFIRGTSTNWCFGVNGTGNVMDRENFEQLKRTCSDRGLDRVHLVGRLVDLFHGNLYEKYLKVSQLHL